MNVAKRVMQILAGVLALVAGVPIIVFLGLMLAVIVNIAMVAIICCGVVYVAVIAVYIGIGTLRLDEAIEILREGPPARDFSSGKGRFN